MNIAKFFNHNFDDGGFFLYDKDGNEIYSEYSDRFWCKRKINGNIYYHEYSDGYWCKDEFDENGELVYYENSIDGILFDNRLKSCNNKIVEIDGKKYQLKEIK